MLSPQDGVTHLAGKASPRVRSSSQPLNAFLRSLTPVPSLFHCGPPRIPTCLLSAPELPLHGPRSQGSQYKPCLPPREKFAAPGSSTQWSLGGACCVHLWGEQRPDPFLGGRPRRACAEPLHSCLAARQARTGSLARKGPAYRCLLCRPVAHWRVPVSTGLLARWRSFTPARHVCWSAVPRRARFLRTL